MKRLLVATVLSMAASFALLSAPVAVNADTQPQTRSVQGQVLNAQDAPLADAIVYLKNTKTMAVKTYIAGRDGTYHFSALSPSIDYEVYAEHQGKRSETKTLSSFDSRKSVTINLKVK